MSATMATAYALLAPLTVAVLGLVHLMSRDDEWRRRRNKRDLKKNVLNWRNR